MKEFQPLLDEIGIQFENINLLIQAFTHSSHVNESKHGQKRDNERLEFLGDAVLELTISEYLYYHYPGMTEGEMTKFRANIVCEPSLVNFAEQLKFGQYVLLGKGEEMTGGRHRPALLADVFEAFIGAVYLDQGISSVRDFLGKYVFPRIDQGEFNQVNDYKSQLQEWIQQDNKGHVSYTIIEERGPAHDREFVSEVKVGDESFGIGIGRSKKEAEQKAAAVALKRLQQK